jgi:hypothetical protein
MMNTPDHFATTQEEMKRLRPGDHLCCIYRDFKDQMGVIIPYFVSGLGNHEKCLYITDEKGKEDICSAFRRAGVELEKHIVSGQFVFLTNEDAYLKGGCFDPDRMIAALSEAERDSLKDGYTGLRVTGEMTWIFTGLPGTERLIEYEAKLNMFFPGSRTIAICQYHEPRFSPDLLLDVIHTHPKVVIDGLNLRY